MIIKNRFMAAALIAASFASTTVAARAASGTTATAAGTASATIVAPIVLTHTTGSALNFGKFTVGAGGTVVVTPAGAGSTTSDVGFVPGGSTTTADQFTVTADGNRNFGITTTSGTISNGTKTMSFTTVPSSASLTSSSSGTANFTVGGTLTVTGTETPGSYTGTYNATVQYQ